jgi:hypothetical protein
MSQLVTLNWTKPKLTPVGAPDRFTIQTLKKELIQNALSQPTHLGGGQHGFVGLVVEGAEYNTITGTAPAFVFPVHPGAGPDVPVGATQIQTITALNTYDRELRTFHHCIEARNGLKSQLLNSINPIYTSTLEDPQTLYQTVSIHAILTHLSTTYGKVTGEDLDKNDRDMEKEWMPDSPIESLWQQIEDARRFAEPDEEIPDSKAIRVTLALLRNTGLFTKDIKDWEKKEADDKTWSNLKVMFTEANQLRLKQPATTTAAAGYNTANTASTDTTTPNTSTTETSEDWIIKYCWSHGLYMSPWGKGHCSNECTRKRDGHKDDATYKKRMNGSTTWNCIPRGRRGPNE